MGAVHAILRAWREVVEWSDSVHGFEWAIVGFAGGILVGSVSAVVFMLVWIAAGGLR